MHYTLRKLWKEIGESKQGIEELGKYSILIFNGVTLIYCHN